MTLESVTAGLHLPNEDQLLSYIEANAAVAERMCALKSRSGMSVAICGAGPSLADHLHAMHDADEVWACNSALPYLWDQGVRVTHGLSIDHTLGMLRPAEWSRTFPVTYLVASSVHPQVISHLLKAGRRLVFFHNYLGVDDPPGWIREEPDRLAYEQWLYFHRYPRQGPTIIQAGHGLNAVPRAVCLALGMDYARIDVYGADCAFRAGLPPIPSDRDDAAYVQWLQAAVCYADGRSAFDAFGDTAICEAVIDGRRWHSRGDMLISARHLVELARSYPRIRLMGDTMPNAFKDKDAAFWADMPQLSGYGQVVGLRRHAA